MAAQRAAPGAAAPQLVNRLFCRAPVGPPIQSRSPLFEPGIDQRHWALVVMSLAPIQAADVRYCAMKRFSSSESMRTRLMPLAVQAFCADDCEPGVPVVMISVPPSATVSGGKVPPQNQ